MPAAAQDAVQAPGVAPTALVHSTVRAPAPAPAGPVLSVLPPGVAWLEASTPVLAQRTAPATTPAPASNLPPPPGPGQIAAIGLGISVIGAGLVLLMRARRTPPDVRCDPPLPLVGPVRRATLLTLGICTVVGGYHLAAWSVPAWLPLHVPMHRWWMLALGLTLAVAGTLLAERLEHDAPGEKPTDPSA